MKDDEKFEFILDVASEYGIVVNNAYEVIKAYEREFGEFSMNYSNIVKILKEGNYEKV